MNTNPGALPTRFLDPETGFTLDLTGMQFGDGAAAELVCPAAGETLSKLEQAHREMQKLENGAIKNPDEGRRVTHFTDRISYLESDLYRDVQEFAETIRAGEIEAAGGTFENVVINGIGGSALGPQLLQFAIRGPYWNEMSPQDRGGYPRIYFLDNTDPAGVADLAMLLDFSRTLVVTISKSGGTQETRNNMLAFEAIYRTRGLDFAPHACAVTMNGSSLDAHARAEAWRQVFYMAESIGGRTSETNIVGHVPAALTGMDFAALVNGAKWMDEMTRREALAENPAYMLAAAWYIAGNGRGDRNMVVVPYSDRLVLLAKYLQQLVMESLGKEKDLDGNTVHQGLTVYGNKGGTDAHAYIQQLNDGRDDFFVTFIEILKDAWAVELGDGLQMGDYLHAFKAGLVNALTGKGRRVSQIILDRLDEFALGMLIALYERAVAVYAEFIHINAFHQPGVQAYKLASKAVNELSERLRHWITEVPAGWRGTAEDVARELGAPAPEVGELLAKYAVNEREFEGRRVTRKLTPDGAVFSI